MFFFKLLARTNTPLALCGAVINDEKLNHNSEKSKYNNCIYMLAEAKVVESSCAFLKSKVERKLRGGMAASVTVACMG